MDNHEPARPIEAGCLAMIIKSVAGFNNRPVTVITCFYKGGIKRWEIDVGLVDVSGYPSPTNGIWSASDDQLLRIDDPSIQSQIESEKEKVCG